MSLTDADRVMLVMMEELLDTAMEIGSACIDVGNRIKYMPEGSANTAELQRVVRAYNQWLDVKERLDYIDPDLKVK